MNFDKYLIDPPDTEPSDEEEMILYCVEDMVCTCEDEESYDDACVVYDLKIKDALEQFCYDYEVKLTDYIKDEIESRTFDQLKKIYSERNND